MLEEGLAGVTLIDLSDCLGSLTARRGLRAGPGSGRRGPARGPQRQQGVEWFGRPDTLGGAEAEALARRLAPCRLGARGRRGRRGAAADQPAACSSCSASPGSPTTFDVSRPGARGRCATGCGCRSASRPSGQPVELDIKEAAQEGMGPHGLCIGATGSGKSEFLRTLVLGHDRHALVRGAQPRARRLQGRRDVRSGSTGAPHVAAVITNLADDLSLVDRMQDALAGEMNRRQEKLRAAGNFANVTRVRAGPGERRRRSTRCPRCSSSSTSSPSC